MNEQIPNVGSIDVTKKTSAIEDEGAEKRGNEARAVDPYCYFNGEQHSQGSEVCSKQ